MQNTFQNSLIMIVVLAAAILFFVHTCRETKPANNGSVVIEKKAVLNIPKDTMGKYVPVEVMEKVTKDTVAYWMKRYNAIAKTISSAAVPIVSTIVIEPRKDSVIVDSVDHRDDNVFNDYFLPYRVKIVNKVSINFLTINPLDPIEQRVRQDSTEYLLDSVDVKTNLTKEDCKRFEDSWYDHWETKTAGGVLFVAAVLNLIL